MIKTGLQNAMKILSRDKTSNISSLNITGFLLTYAILKTLQIVVLHSILGSLLFILGWVY